jgi:cardiolipin synthase A/B
VVRVRLRAERRASLLGAEAELEAMQASERRIFKVCSGHGAGTEISAGNRVELLGDGRAAIDAMSCAIDGAKESVLFECYLIRNDETGKAFRGQLVRAAERGVDVRVLVDAYGCFWLPNSWYRPLRRAGVKVAEFLPLRLAFRLPMNLRTHRKILIVDGSVAFTGGVNIGDEYARATPSEPMWCDSHIKVEGPAVGSLTGVFLRDWHFMTGEMAVSEGFFPTCSAGGTVTMAVVPSGPDDTLEAIHRTFFAAIVSAQRRVWITTPYFVPAVRCWSRSKPRPCAGSMCR